MKIITRIEDLQNELAPLRNEGKQIGFVPTMGYLHEGHEKLLSEARRNNDVIVLSIFVNPLQFGANEDLDKYPRDMDRDEQVAKNHDVDFIFFPTVQEMYPEEPSVTVKVMKRTNVLCGTSRPGHFDGVATVLTKLFNIVHPDRAYFGLKDAQQVAVVEGLVSDLNIPVEIVRVEIVREEDGLAKSSRNVYLLEEERQEAKELNASLQLAKTSIQDGERNPEIIRKLMTEYLTKATNGKIDYIEIYSYPSLEPIKELQGQCIIALAVAFKSARLIDNIIFTI
ncbi:pantoate--beta-alanine ligase [Bacillus massiliigorillae]|uniref:pantoate--beta-alanine ligase n=1 Tax=Bacillus massiliigorillae TaxID=1243664 RepID=UPI0003AA428A|nr:pantoate--beta-alanine ligase [Bacillus massiliigorillae]